MADKGATTTQNNNESKNQENFMQKQQGVFGGLNRVYEGFQDTQTQFKDIAKEARGFVKAGQKNIEMMNNQDASEAERQAANRRVVNEIPVQKRMMPTQLEIDEKLSTLKANAMDRFGPNNQSAGAYLRDL